MPTPIFSGFSATARHRPRKSVDSRDIIAAIGFEVIKYYDLYAAVRNAFRRGVARTRSDGILSLLPA
ncbi:hypothetical protein KCP69_04315 [Salmonella enterica subsp. enterica]|nr:hypothetical protein KCP69_04315 [Salmonella enterica subsp. enterica]